METLLEIAQLTSMFIGIACMIVGTAAFCMYIAHKINLIRCKVMLDDYKNNLKGRLTVLYDHTSIIPLSSMAVEYIRDNIIDDGLISREKFKSILEQTLLDQSKKYSDKIWEQAGIEFKNAFEIIKKSTNSMNRQKINWPIIKDLEIKPK